MAEILGIISSSITVIEVAAKLGSSTLRLKHLWNEIQDVPETIRQCIEELELLAPAIRDIENDFQQAHSIVQLNSTARRSLESCQKTIHTLDVLIKDMEKHVNSAKRSRRLVAQVKVRLKKEVIEKHHQQLDSTLRALNLSYQIHLGALIKAQPDIIMSKWKVWQESEYRETFASHTVKEKESEESMSVASCPAVAEMPPLSTSPPTPGNRSSWPIARPIGWRKPGILGNLFYRFYEVAGDEAHTEDLGKTKVHQLRLQMPSWLIKVGWGLQAYQSSCGWKMRLINWNTRPSDAKIFQYIKDNETDLVLRAIKSGEASIYDLDEEGDTLLHLALSRVNLDIVKLLDRIGLPVASIEMLALSAKIHVWSWSQWNATAAVEVGSMWLMENDTTVMLQYESPDLLVMLSGLVWGVPDLWKLGFSSCEKILEIEIDWRLLDPAIPLDMLGQKVLTSVQLRRHVMHEDGTLHKFTWQYFHAILNRANNLEDWRTLAKKMLRGTPPNQVAALFQCESSTIANLITSLWRRQFAIRSFEQWIVKALNIWLEDLAEAGIDLEEYMFWEIFESRAVSPFRGHDEDPTEDASDETDEESYERSDDDTDDGAHEQADDGDDDQIDCETVVLGRNKTLQQVPSAWLKSNRGVRIPESGSSLTILMSGKAVDDWLFAWDPCVEELVGEFWASIEYPHMEIPGAWVDDDEESEEGGTSGCQMRCFDRCGNHCCSFGGLREWVRGLDINVGQRPLKVRGMRECKSHEGLV